MNRLTYILILVLGTLSTIAYAGTVYYINGINYELNHYEHTATVVKRNTSSTKFGTEHVIIPENVYYNDQEYLVVEIGANAFNGYDDVHFVTLPYSIKRIQSQAFAYLGGYIGCVIRFDGAPPAYVSNAYAEREGLGGSSFDFDALYENGFLQKGTVLRENGEVEPNDEPLPDDYWDGWDEDVDGRRPKPQPKVRTGYGGKQFNKIYIPENAIWYKTKNNTSLTVTHPENFPSLVDSLVGYNTGRKEGLISTRFAITYVPEAAFAGARELTVVLVNKDVKEIMPAAFYGCYSLQRILMKQSNYQESPLSTTNIHSIGDSAFMNCTALDTVRWANNVSTLGDKCFKNCTKLVSVPFWNKVTYIPAEAFANTALPVVETASPVHVDNGAFQDCRLLTKVHLPSARYIGEQAFEQCEKLVSANLPGATIIGDGAFYQCPALHDLTLTVADTIGEMAFAGCSGLEEITLPNARTVGAYAFDECTALQKISFGNRLVTVPTGMCEHCTSLAQVDAPQIGIVGPRAFYGCAKLATIDLSHATDIRSQAFVGCTSLKQLDLGPNLFTIGDSAFAGCAGITSAHCRSIVPPALGKQAFAGVNVGNIILYVPRGTVEMYRSSDWGKYEWKDIRADLDMTITADLYCGDTIALASSLTGFLATGQKLQLSSSNNNIAIVDTNNVVRVKNTPGEVTITATIPNTIYAKTLRFRIHPKPTPTPQPSYKVIARQNKGGVVTPEVTQAHQGEWVDVTVQPDAKYMLDTVAAQSDTVHWNRPVELYMNVQDYTKYRFSMPDSYVAVGASFSQPQKLFLNENQNHVADYTKYYGQIMNVTLGRTFTPGIIYTFALPFDLPTLVGTPLEGCTIAHAIYATRDDNNGLQVRFTTDPQGQDTCPAIHAGHPYLLWVKKPITQPTFEFVCISDITGQNDTISDKVVIHGLTSPQQVPGQDKNYLFFSGNKLCYPSHTGTIKAFRAFLQILNKQDYGIKPSYWIMDNGRTWQGEGEELDFPLETDEQGTDMDLIEMGVPMQLPCYKYLDNNHIVIFRNGKRYTIQGQLIK